MPATRNKKQQREKRQQRAAKNCTRRLGRPNNTVLVRCTGRLWRNGGFVAQDQLQAWCCKDLMHPAGNKYPAASVVIKPLQIPKGSLKHWIRMARLWFLKELGKHPPIFNSTAPHQTWAGP